MINFQLAPRGLINKGGPFMDLWKLWQSIGYGLLIGFIYLIVSQMNTFPITFVVEFVFIVIVAVFSYWRIKSLKFSILFGLVVTLVPEIFGILFFGALPFGYMVLFVYPEFTVLFFVISIVRFVGFPIAGFFGSYIWRIRKENF
jgi:hypothetical protein